MKSFPYLALIASVALMSCTRGEERLPGKRIDVRDALRLGAEDAAQTAPSNVVEPLDIDPRDEVRNSAPISLPRQVNHTSWTHRGGSANHKVTHPSLNATLTKVWSANIGSGNSRRYRISGDPIIAEGRVFAQDSRARVSAFSTAGGQIWSRDLTPASDRNKDATGGGLAYGGGRLFVTTGFGELIALDPASGATVWRQEFDAPVTGTPTVRGDLVYVVSRDNRSFGIRTDTGRIQWQLPGAPSNSDLITGAGPAVTERLAIFPNGQSEVNAALRKGGIRVWGGSIAGQRRGRAYAGITDITGDPVVVGNTVYVGSQSGRFAALDATSGERRWTATEGSYSPGWPVGGSVFIVSDQAQLVRLDDSTGEVIWAVDLPYFKRERVRRRKGVFAHYGPVLAGGRLIVGSDDGQIRSFDPRTGQLISSVGIPGGAASLPAVVGGTLYILSGNGQLHAFR
ncbi:PQQ-binding-like beta-propeller repeat protein [Actibacterium sp. 188UL27-1]|uniref:PQQ-like beta-propeller repeat protein n=1 Tax=Actibacterium sp. 188UL27-1 TaxID=2786961 RepID=UPI00351C9528